MTIRLSCPGCGRPVDCRDDRAGQVEICPHCQQKMRVPGDAADEPRGERRPRRRGRDDDQDNPFRRREDDDEDHRPRRRGRGIDVPPDARLRRVGEPVSEYRAQGATFQLVIGIVLCVIGLPFLIVGVGLIFIGIGAFLIYQGSSNLSRRVIVCEEGFLDCQGSKVREVAWEDVDAVYEKITRVVNQYGWHMRTEYVYRVVLESGGELKYTQTFERIESLGNKIQKEVARAHFDRAMRAIDAGKWVDFDDMRLSRKGIEANGDYLRWDEVDEFSGEQGYFIIHQRYRNGEWARVPFASIPNLRLFTRLLEELSRG